MIEYLIESPQIGKKYLVIKLEGSVKVTHNLTENPCPISDGIYPLTIKIVNIYEKSFARYGLTCIVLSWAVHS
jgi:hypothetical protein